MKKVRILGIIPARGGSKRIPHKNITPLAGKPMICYTIKAAEKSKVLDAFIVSTDDPKIAEIAKSFGADVPFLRPQKYARDYSRDIEYLKHALGWVAKHRGWHPEIVVILPPDCPTRTGADIDAVVRFMIARKLDSVRTLVRPIPYVPYKAMWILKGVRKELIAPLFPQYMGESSQLLPKYYISMGMVYATRAKFIAGGKLWGPRIGGYVMDEKRCIEIDEPEQLKRAERILREMRRA